MPRRASSVPVPSPIPEENPVPEMPEDDFVQSLRNELTRAQKREAKPTEDLEHRAELNRRLLQDLWEVHNQFEEISVHLTVEPPQTLFASFIEYPTKWSFKEGFDFGSVRTIEVKDRTQGWTGFTLRFWFYNNPEGRPHLRAIFEWSDGESYHRYTGWMRTMAQAILYDSPETSVNIKEIHQILRDIVVKWYQAHLEQTPDLLVQHLKEKYPKGPSYSKEAYRG